VGHEILRALGLYREGVRLISCPTCSRCRIDLLERISEVERFVERIRTPMTVAVMGCAVNGPGEAREADIGVAGGGDWAVLFRQGQVVSKVSPEEMLSVLFQEIRRLAAERGEIIP
jgi:(E)-4-hydroxy-3-methylbut-2-enyl-diphosphate synthase